jgi:hypothetical protein
LTGNLKIADVRSYCLPLTLPPICFIVQRDYLSRSGKGEMPLCLSQVCSLSPQFTPPLPTPPPPFELTPVLFNHFIPFDSFYSSTVPTLSLHSVPFPSLTFAYSNFSPPYPYSSRPSPVPRSIPFQFNTLSSNPISFPSLNIFPPVNFFSSYKHFFSLILSSFFPHFIHAIQLLFTQRIFHFDSYWFQLLFSYSILLSLSPFYIYSCITASGSESHQLLAA